MRRATYEIDARYKQLQNGDQMLGTWIINISRNDCRNNRAQRLDHGQGALGLRNYEEETIDERSSGTSTRASSEGIARSRIGWNTRSGSMHDMDFRALWTFVTVVLSWEKMASSTTVRRHLTSSLFISRVSRRV